MPNRFLNTLFGQGGVQTLDNQAHNHRKELFMPLLGQEVIHDFHMIAMKQREKAVDKWIKMDQIILYEE